MAAMLALFLSVVLMMLFLVESQSIGRHDFPENFTFGTASSAYQVRYIPVPQ